MTMHRCPSRRIAIRKPWKFIIPAMLAVLSACAGEATGPANGGGPSGGQVLSFAAIAGEWVGTLDEHVPPADPVVYQGQLTLSSQAAQNTKIGESEYSHGCGGDLVALDVQQNVYTVQEFVTHGQDVCGNGSIRLTRDEAAGTLEYEWFQGENVFVTGTLRRP